MGVVYLLHFDQPYRHARHYIGYTSGGLNKRLERHRAGGGARLLEVITEAGIEFELARTWRPGTRALERQIKRRHCAPKMCPICKGEAK